MIRRRHAVERLRQERVAEKFSQEELAGEIGISRMALANYEQGVSNLPFVVGFALCKRLDLNPRWVVSGEDPKRPFPPLSELGLTEENLKQPRRLVDFVAGYDRVLDLPLQEWSKNTTAEAAVFSIMQAGPERLAKRLSVEDLEKSLVTALCSAVASAEPHKPAHLENVMIFAGELKSRLELKRPQK